jgi:tetratricopeptide (TPR) repeat protein
MSSICLNMIVKNEAHIIVNTLENIITHVPITYWVISDTGSTDNTIELIKKFFADKNIKGELFEHTWKDFGYNRSKALECAYNKTDYLLIFDADDSFHGNLILPPLNKDGYSLVFGSDNGSCEYVRTLLINNRKKWKFIGVLHEYITCEDTNHKLEVIKGNYYIQSGRTGARSADPRKYEKDAIVLSNAYEQEKDVGLKARYAFYCAQSWRDCDNIDNAITWYEKCLPACNWHQEKYFSCLCIGDLYAMKNQMTIALKYWIKTVQYDPERIEGIAKAMEYLRINDLHLFVFALYDTYKNYNKDPKNKLFINKQRYNFDIEYNMSISACYCDKKAIGLDCCRQVLMNYNTINKNIIKITMSNILFYDIKTDHELFNSVNNICSIFKQSNINLDPSVFTLWNKLIDVEKLTEYKEHKHTKKQKINIMLTITKSKCANPNEPIANTKKYKLFQQSINSIVNTWSDIDMIDYWFCVDENSSNKDRLRMKKNYSWIDFHMKTSNEDSMNIIWNKLNEIKPTYWIHVSDEWFFHNYTNYITTGIEYLKDNIKQVMFNYNYGKKITDYNTVNEKQNYFSLDPCIIKLDDVLELGMPNDNDYKQKWTDAKFKTDYFKQITCEINASIT